MFYQYFIEAAGSRVPSWFQLRSHVSDFTTYTLSMCLLGQLCPIAYNYWLSGWISTLHLLQSPTRLYLILLKIVIALSTES
ncbi:hypothetical protein FIBSPDRAFT_465936 [Athelia psychrophila]|uniref:Uncharacterized protein n=1 Tax=Athelia psychrophila TaxID=1759441 RepID=A0A166LJC3_9AGAM|nr:hypothetical protein FIBSPDRAFT_465936 [Fibularhizoctonia sp. CBS 109695]